MTSESACYVYIVLPGETGFVTAGRFTQRESREGAAVGEFVYGRSYRERANAVELDPVELRLQPGQFETARMGGFFGAIRDAMPDAWGRKVIDRHVGGRLAPFDYLLRAPDDRAGALGFGRNTKPPFPENRFNRTLDLERLQRAADAIVNGDDLDFADRSTQRPAGGSVQRAEQRAAVRSQEEAAVRGDVNTSERIERSDIEQAADLLLLGGTSMGGARPKAVVEDSEALWIAKFARTDDDYNEPRAEHGLLELAKRCGLDAADSRLTTVAGRDVLLVRRFDRERAEDAYHRHRMVSAATLLGTDDLPVHRLNWSYLLLADEVRRASAQPADDLRELYRRMVFNAAISNLDDHPRNHAMLARGEGWRLSPAYDLTPFGVVAQERRLALECGLHGRGANKTNLISGHGRFMLNREDATALFDAVVETVRSEWQSSLRRAGLGARDCERLSRAFVHEGLFYDAE